MKPNLIITYWQEKAWEDIASAEENFRASRLSNAVRDAYYACFHLESRKFVSAMEKIIESSTSGTPSMPGSGTREA